eukprot:4689937-Amphidinium_carterae.1
MDARVQALENQLRDMAQHSVRLEGALTEQRQLLAAARAPAEQQQRAVDTRLLGRPKNFGGRDEEWPQWSVIMRAYAGAVSSKLLVEMDHVEAPTVPDPLNANLDPDKKELSVQLYYILAMLLEGRAQDKVANIPRGE